MTIDAGSMLSEPLVNMAWITPQAEGQVNQLSKVDRAKIADALIRPVLRRRCGLVHTLAQCRVYHFRASKTLRVSYRPTERGPCVIHVGTHSQFDQFARCFAGQTSTNLIPLQESLIMKNHSSAGKNGTGKMQIGVQPPQQVALLDDEHLLVEVLREIISKAIGPHCDALTSDWAARLDAIRKDIEQTSQESSRATAKQDSRLTGLSNECRGKLSDLSHVVEQIGTSQQELTALIATVRSELETSCQARSRDVEEIRTEVTRQTIQMNSARKDVEQRIAALGGHVEKRVREAVARLDVLETTVESHDTVGRASISEIEARVDEAHQALGSLKEVLNGLARTTQSQQQTMSRLEETLSRVSAWEFTAPQANDGWYRRTLNWVRAFARPAA